MGITEKYDHVIFGYIWQAIPDHLTEPPHSYFQTNC
jgi:hypothetical protein